MSAEPRVLERVVRVAPFGVAFWDALLERAVAEGLAVTVAPASQPRRRRAAIRTRAGIYAAQGLPGLREVEFGETDFPVSPPEPHPFRVEVTDATGRFHDVSFEAGLPFEDLFEAECGSPPSPPAEPAQAVPLFSLPGRPVPPGYAAVRTRLLNEAANPVPLAALEVVAAGRRHRGYADRRGEVAVLLPYPEPAGAVASPPSPPAAPGGKLSSQTWEVEVRADLPAAPPGDLDHPDLCAFALRRPASLLDRDGVPLPAVHTLAFGRDLVLPGDPQPTELVVVPA